MSTQTNPVQAKPLRILVIEPDDMIRKMYGLFLARNKARPEVILVENHDHALRVVLHENPDVVITNQGRPPHGFRGTTTSSLIKKLRPRTRTIMITGNNIAKPASIDVLLKKPVLHPTDLDSAIMQVLGLNGG